MTKDEILKDHRKVAELFEKFRAEEDPSKKHAVVRELILALTKHSEEEEREVYPKLYKKSAKGEALVTRARMEHDEIRPLADRIYHSDFYAPNAAWVGEAGILEARVKAHVEFEEAELLPLL